MPYIPRKRQDFFFSFNKKEYRREKVDIDEFLLVDYSQKCTNPVPDAYSRTQALYAIMYDGYQNYISPVVAYFTESPILNWGINQFEELYKVFPNFHLTSKRRYYLRIADSDSTGDASTTQPFNGNSEVAALTEYIENMSWRFNPIQYSYNGYATNVAYIEQDLITQCIPSFYSTSSNRGYVTSEKVLSKLYQFQKVPKLVSSVEFESVNSSVPIDPYGNPFKQEGNYWAVEQQKTYTTTDINTQDFGPGQGTRLWNVGNILINIPYLCSVHGPYTGRLWERFPNLQDKYMILIYNQLGVENWFAYRTQYRAQYKDTEQILQLSPDVQFESRLGNLMSWESWDVAKQRANLSLTQQSSFNIVKELGIPSLRDTNVLKYLLNWETLTVNQKLKIMNLEGVDFGNTNPAIYLAKLLMVPSGGYQGGGEVLTAYL